MLTYVINTSGNKTFESDRLFEMAGYHKIRWINCSLSEIEQYGKMICEKQSVLGAGSFRIAVLIDFYEFDRLRVPYARQELGKADGVDVEIYVPYIEAYLTDRLQRQLDRNELRAADFEVFYIQNMEWENLSNIHNAKEQAARILEGCEDKATAEDSAEKKHAAFRLYCTPKESVELRLRDYPYGAERMTFSEFFEAFRYRNGNRTNIRRHFYITQYGGGKARAALDTLSLSLHMIRLYELERALPGEGSIRVPTLDTDRLRAVLERAWNKIQAAKKVAQENDSDYYSMEENVGLLTSLGDSSPLTSVEGEDDENCSGWSMEVLYQSICEICQRSPEDVALRNSAEMDQIMAAYLVERDENREIDVKEDFDEMVRSNSLVLTKQCPSQAIYRQVLTKKQDEISECFQRTLTAARVEQDYTEEMEQADAIYNRYASAKLSLRRSFFGDLLFMIATLLVMLVPYISLQLAYYPGSVLPSVFLLGNFAVMFAVLFFFSLFLWRIPALLRMHREKKLLCECYRKCLRKERACMAQIRRRYQVDLINIERVRFELRRLRCLYEANLEKNRNIENHQNMLETLEDHLSAMLNQLDIRPIFDPSVDVSQEFDPSLPIESDKNKVYRIFSIDAIDEMFPKKGSDVI